jgi:hypothetical protein
MNAWIFRRVGFSCHCEFPPAGSGRPALDETEVSSPRDQGTFVIPAQAGTQSLLIARAAPLWVPACTGMTRQLTAAWSSVTVAKQSPFRCVLRWRLPRRCAPRNDRETAFTLSYAEGLMVSVSSTAAPRRPQCHGDRHAATQAIPRRWNRHRSRSGHSGDPTSEGRIGTDAAHRLYFAVGFAGRRHSPMKLPNVQAVASRSSSSRTPLSAPMWNC